MSASNMTPQLKESLTYLCHEHQKYNYISPDDWAKYDVKRGLRNANGTGVLAGLTSICDVVGYGLEDGIRVPCEGRLIYRGVDVSDIIAAGQRDNRYVYEEVVWLLLFGSFPTSGELEMFRVVLASLSELPEGFAENMLMKSPSPNVMNAMSRAVLALYAYDELAEDQSLENTLYQAIKLIACVPTIMTGAYQVKRRFFEKKSMYMHHTHAEYSIAQNILRTSRSDKQFSEDEAMLLDLCLVLHADHGGGNNSAFATRVVTSSATDTYGAIAAALSSLKGPRHGGANIKVMEMLDEMKEVVDDYNDDDKIVRYLEGVLDRHYGDRTGLIYGVGHAVYTQNDPRAVILRENAAKLAHENGMDDDYRLLCAIERLAPDVVTCKKGMKAVCANVDLFSGLVFRVMRIPPDLYTPLFAVSRMAGWCAHLVEERLFGNRIIRPAYKYIGVGREYTPLGERK